MLGGDTVSKERNASPPRIFCGQIHFALLQKKPCLKSALSRILTEVQSHSQAESGVRGTIETKEGLVQSH